jgi:hypothetical protein
MIASDKDWESVRHGGGIWPRIALSGEWIHRNRRVATFVCAGCKRRVPWSQGAADNHGELCDDCANAKERESGC